MTTPTWGIPIPGYSYPSSAQKKKFSRMYPGVADMVLSVREESSKRADERAAAIVRAEKAKQASCTHEWVPTNVEKNHVCKLCKLWVESLKTLRRCPTQYPEDYLKPAKKKGEA